VNISEETLKNILKSIDLKGLLDEAKKDAGELAVLITTEAINRFGVAGLHVAEEVFRKGELPDWASPRIESEWLAFKQNVQADGLEKSREAVAKIKEIAIKVGVEVLKAALIAAV
jgi:hypothetical protein